MLKPKLEDILIILFPKACNRMMRQASYKCIEKLDIAAYALEHVPFANNEFHRRWIALRMAITASLNTLKDG